jgi:hypothetical protein
MYCKMIKHLTFFYIKQTKVDESAMKKKIKSKSTSFIKFGGSNGLQSSISVSRLVRKANKYFFFLVK